MIQFLTYLTIISFSIYFEVKRLVRISKDFKPKPRLYPLSKLESVDDYYSRKLKWARFYSCLVVLWFLLWFGVILIEILLNLETAFLPSLLISIIEFIANKKVFAFILSLAGMIFGRFWFRFK
jgi:hypothetical protein